MSEESSPVPATPAEIEAQPHKAFGSHRRQACRPRRGLKALALLAVLGVAGFFAWKAWAGEQFDCSAAALRDPARFHARTERLATRELDRFAMPADHRAAARDTILSAADELQPLLAAHYAARQSLIDVLSAERVDPIQLESLRAASIARADQASRMLSSALIKLGDQLTPSQRRELLARWMPTHD